MATNKNKGFLLFIEPENIKEIPIIDFYTRKITGAFNKALAMGGSNYSHGETAQFCDGIVTRGWHTCSCGAHSSNADYLLTTKDINSSVVRHQNSRDFFSGKESDSISGLVITNSLCIHYIACHRDEIPQEELDSILNLEGDEEYPTPDQIQ